MANAIGTPTRRLLARIDRLGPVTAAPWEYKALSRSSILVKYQLIRGIRWRESASLGRRS